MLEMILGSAWPIIAAIGALIGGWFVHRRGVVQGRRDAALDAAQSQQQARERADEAVRDAQRTGASQRLRDGNF
jgi:polysaccharide deacetylase 2 family uncharacterized protein YibQ